MAVVNDNQAKRKIEREKKKYNAVKKKADIIEKKEAFGSSWKEGLSEENKQELKKAVGTADCPTVVDISDLHNFFDPINLFTDEEGNVNRFNYDAYVEAQKAYQNGIDECDKIIYEEDELTETTQDLLNKELAGRSDSGKKKRELPKLPDYLTKQYQKWAKYFGRIVPVYDKYICTCCGRPLDINKFYLTYGEQDLARVEIDGKMHTHICIDCCKKLFEYLFYEKANKDAQETMMWFCSYLNIYYDEKSYLQAK